MAAEPKKKARRPRRPTWRETRRTEITPYISNMNNGRVAYAARRWVVEEIMEATINGMLTIEMRERIVVGRTLQAYEAGVIGEQLMTITNQMNLMLVEILQTYRPSEDEIKERAKVPHLDKMEKVLEAPTKSRWGRLIPEPSIGPEVYESMVHHKENRLHNLDLEEDGRLEE